ncbi:MAG: DUF1934 domain-containing protein [Clostridia bacterium]|jgi:uncharacterized beta-barrel protein YwiB (DUF1934 family)|nr:DUF1934 domain-containing protein [Clostridia bacterium]
MKNISLRITSKMDEDRVPPRCGNLKISQAEEDSILNSVEDALPENDEVEAEVFFTEAVMDISSTGIFTIRYEESELSGMEGTTTELIFSKNEPSLVTLRRTGTVRCAIVMEEHRQHSGVYQTPVMPLDLTVTTHSLTNTITEDGGVLDAYYSIRFGTVTTTRTRLKMEVTVR